MCTPRWAYPKAFHYEESHALALRIQHVESHVRLVWFPFYNSPSVTAHAATQPLVPPSKNFLVLSYSITSPFGPGRRPETPGDVRKSAFHLMSVSFHKFPSTWVEVVLAPYV